MALSERQQRILAFIEQYGEENGYPPTIREIGKAVGISSTSVVKYNLERLKEKGCIDRSKEVSRGLRLVKKAPADGAEAAQALRQSIQVPIFGTIAAGLPIAATGQQDDPYSHELLSVPAEMVPSGENIYALKVQGDSMIDALVADGDWIVIRHQETAQPRDMIVAWIKDKEETTLKYYYPEGNHVWLRPANPAYKPIPVAADQLQIQGKVVAVMRRLE
jgi:repressor LexA